jgi:V8-like Glu-specific endopeptidase
MSQDFGSSKSLVEKYSQLLQLESGAKSRDRQGGLEGNSETVTPAIEMTERGIKDSIEKMNSRLKKFAAKYYGSDRADESQKQIDTICGNIAQGLELLRNKDEEGLKSNPKAVSGLEEVIIGDGSRPMYMIQQDEVDLDSATSLVLANGNPIWEPIIQDAYSLGGLREVMPSVGVLRSRVDRSDPYGTAFLVAPNLVMTNKHVWDQIYNQHDERYDEVVVDFQYEVNNRTGQKIRQLESVVFLGFGDRMSPVIDVALFSLNGEATFDQTPFDIHAGRWLRLGKERKVFVIGHPEIPKNKTDLQRFLSGTSFVKRLCPGEAIHHMKGKPIYHNASTTEMCSGAVVVSCDNSSRVAIGIHHGYETLQNRQMTNLAHALQEILDKKSTTESTALNGTLRQILENFGAQFDETDLLD